MTNEQIDNTFTYHRPFGDQPQKYEALRNMAKMLATLIQGSCPESREKSVAFTKLQECAQMANASIAIHEVEANAIQSSHAPL